MFIDLRSPCVSLHSNKRHHFPFLVLILVGVINQRSCYSRMAQDSIEMTTSDAVGCTEQTEPLTTDERAHATRMPNPTSLCAR